MRYVHTLRFSLSLCTFTGPSELVDTQKRIRSAIESREVRLCKFRVLNVNLAAMGTRGLELLGDLNEMADKMEDKWREELVKKERKILYLVLDRFEPDADKNGFTFTQYNEFKRLLPMHYQERLMQRGDWKSIAGEDGVMRRAEFYALVDAFAEEHVMNQQETRRKMSLVQVERQVDGR